MNNNSDTRTVKMMEQVEFENQILQKELDSPILKPDIKKEYEEREYQTFLFEKAKHENTILCLPTGCGKTFIAVQLVKYYLAQTIKRNQKIIFVAPTVPLAHQQGNYLKEHISRTPNGPDSHVKVITGNMSPETWDGQKWKDILSGPHIFAMTPQTILNAITRGLISWKTVSLLILDECHNATKEHPMAMLVDDYGKKRSEGGIVGETLPRILGLTATIIKGTSKGLKVEQEIVDIQNRLCACAVTYHDYEEVLKFSTSAIVEMVGYSNDLWKQELYCWRTFLEEIITTMEGLGFFLLEEESDDPVENIRDQSLTEASQLFSKKENPLHPFFCHIDEIIDVMNELGIFCGRIAAMVKLVSLKRVISLEQRKGRIKKNATLIVFINVIIAKLERFIILLQDYMTANSGSCKQKDWVGLFISPKLDALVQILAQQRPSQRKGQEQFCGLIFCQQRITTQILCFFLQDLSEVTGNRGNMFNFIRCSFVRGIANRNDRAALKASLKIQTNVLNDFRHDKINLVVATNVLEEGLNVPNCNFIARFDPILSYPSFVQSMGRARQKGAKFYAFVEESKFEKSCSDIKQFSSFNSLLSESLAKKAEHPEQYLMDDNGDHEESEINRLVPPFIPAKDSDAKITAASAVQIVYRYCQSLACDKLSVLIPRSWWVLDSDKMFTVHVMLPVGAVIKKGEGLPYASKSLAKKSAFLEVCKKLYAAGALHHKTLLPLPRNIPLFSDKYIDCMEGIENSLVKEKKIGSKNRLNWYPRQIPQVFQTSVPTEPFRANETNWRVFAIVLSLESYFGMEDLQGLLEFKKVHYLYGIITTADLTKVSDFLLLSRDGSFQVNLVEVNVSGCAGDPLRLSTSQIEELKVFQESIFLDLLNLKHNVLKTGVSAYYIAPLWTDAPGILSSNVQIHWELMAKVSKGRVIDYKEEISIAERRQMTFDSNQYNDALIVPWYNTAHTSKTKKMFVVVAVETDKNPLSPFDDPNKAYSYVDYFNQSKIQIVNKDSQPLLKSKAISEQLNYLAPKYEKHLMSSIERREARHCKSAVVMIPELVRIHPLPGCLFIQAKMLPSCLHRIHRLLLAEEIRSSVAQQASWNVNYESIMLDNRIMLKQMDNEISIIARRHLIEVIESPPQNNQIMVSGPRQSTNEGPLPDSDGVVKSVAEMNTLFVPKQELLWCELEYIHPKLLKLGDLNWGNDEGMEDLNLDSDEEIEDVDSSVIYDDDGPTIFPSDDMRGSDLINTKDVPPQNFDHVTDFNEERGPLPYTLMEALTLANGRDNISLEKLEMIGDSVLKLIVTCHLFTHFPESNEGRLTTTKCRLISNRHLFAVDNKNTKSLGAFLSGSLYEPETSWLPPGAEIHPNITKAALNNNVNYAPFSHMTGEDDSVPLIDVDSCSLDELTTWVSSRIKNPLNKTKVPKHTSYTHSRLGDKSIADGVEALIGAYYVNGGIDSAVRLMDWIGLRGPSKERFEGVPYTHIRDMPVVNPDYPVFEDPESVVNWISEIENVLDYRFQNRWYLVEAMTHPSYLNNAMTNGYQRLEFLGDAILDFIITHYIYMTKKAETPGDLTDLRSALVNNITFGSLTVRYGLHKWLNHFSSGLQDAIDGFVNCQEKNGHRVTGHFSLISEDDSLIANDIEVPKALGDIFESLAGAIFLDSGMSLDAVWKVFYRLMKNEIDQFSLNTPKAPVRKIHEMFPLSVKFQELKCSDSEELDLGFKVVQLDVPGFPPFIGSGSNKKNAKQAAAKFALRTIEEMKGKKL